VASSIGRDNSAGASKVVASMALTALPSWNLHLAIVTLRAAALWWVSMAYARYTEVC